MLAEGAALIVLYKANASIRSARADLPLVFNRREPGAQVGLGRQGGLFFLRTPTFLRLALMERCPKAFNLAGTLFWLTV